MPKKTRIKEILNSVAKNLWVLVPLFCLITTVKCYSIYVNSNDAKSN